MALQQDIEVGGRTYTDAYLRIAHWAVTKSHGRWRPEVDCWLEVYRDAAEADDETVEPLTRIQRTLEDFKNAGAEINGKAIGREHFDTPAEKRGKPIDLRERMYTALKQMPDHAEAADV